MIWVRDSTSASVVAAGLLNPLDHETNACLLRLVGIFVSVSRCTEAVLLQQLLLPLG